MITTFEQMLDRWPQSPALSIQSSTPGPWLTATRAELNAAAAQFAAHLTSLGIKRGEAIALWLPDGFTWLQCFFGAARMGVLTIPLSTRYREQEIRHLLTVSRARAVVAAETFVGFAFGDAIRALQPGLPDLAHLIIADDAIARFNAFAPSSAPVMTGVATDPCCTFSTSGTTGYPKLAVHDQASMVEHARHAATFFEFGRDDRLLCNLPLFGTFGMMSLLAALYAGSTCVLMPVFDARGTAEQIARQNISHCFGSDAAFDAVLDAAAIEPRCNLSGWRVGGLADFAGISARVVARAEAEHGVRLCGLYGSSECFALMAARRPREALPKRALTAGQPVSDGIQTRVVDIEHGAVLPSGGTGELQIRGYNVMSGYLNNPEATQRAFTEDGWFRSGDLCTAESDGFQYLSRLNDNLRLRGYLVDPSEIEACLLTAPGVAGVQVVGARRSGEGDIAVAFVIRNAGSDGQLCDEASLIAHCRERIAAYKAPRHVVFVDEFPSVNGPNGVKIQKTQLREMARARFSEP